MCDIKRESISKKYFGIEIEKTIFNEMYELKCNDILNIDKVKEIALSIYGSQCSQNQNIYISSNSMNIKRAQDTLKKNIFKQSDSDLKKTDANGWLVLFDKDNKANWGHPCSYLFIITEKYYLKEDGILPPENNIKLIKII